MRSARWIRLGVLVALVLLALPVVGLVSHSSLNPTIWGRFSRSYFLFLIVYLGAAFLTALALVLALRADDDQVNAAANHVAALRRRRLLFLAALLLPWVVLFVLLDSTREYSPTRSSIFQLSLVALVILIDLALLTLARPPAEARAAAAGLLLVLVSLGVSLGVMEYVLRRIPPLIPNAARPHLPGNGMFLRQDLVFDKPMQVGYRYQAMQDRWYEFRVGDGDLYRLEPDSLPPLPPDQNTVLARVHFVTDEIGYPNQPPLAERYDLVVTGDSFTAPGNVSTAWWQRVAELTGMRVLNLAMPGYSPRPEAEAVKLYGLSKQPRTVLVAYFEGNDLTIEPLSFEAKRRSGLSWIEDDLDKAGPFASSVALQSLRFGIPELLNRAGAALAQVRAGDASSNSKGQVSAQPSEQVAPPVFYSAYVAALTAARADIESSDNFRLVTEAFLDLQRAVAANGGQLVIVYIPSKERTYWTLLSPTELARRFPEGVPSIRLLRGELGSGGRMPLELASSHMNDQRDALRDFAERSGIGFLDLSDSFRAAAAQGSELYYATDTHWNQAGHDLAGKLVAEYLKRR